MSQPAADLDRGALAGAHGAVHVARVPNLSAWRRRTTGDLTSAFNFAARPDARRPALAAPGATTRFGAAPVTASAQPFPCQPKLKRRKPSGIV